MKKNKKGFTLAEMLIVVAIIAVLVAIAIPFFTSQIEKSREAADLANVRNAYAEIMTAAITEDKDACYSVDGKKIYSEEDNLYKVSVPLKQKKSGWDMNTDGLTVAGVSRDTDYGTLWISDPSGKEGSTCEVSFDLASAKLILNWDGEESGSDPEPVVITGLGEFLSRMCAGWNMDKETSLMFVGGASTGTSASRVTLTTTPIALAKGATVEISSEDGYQTGYFIMKYDAEAGGFVSVFDSGWRKGTVTFTVEDDDYYLVTNTKKDSGNITAAEAESNVSVNITGNESAYSTAGMTSTSLSTMSGVTAKTATGLSNSTSSTRAGGTVSETSANNRFSAYLDAEEGQILSLSGSDEYNYAYFFLTENNTVLFDSGWLGYGNSTAIVVPEDCKVAVQVQKKSGKATEEYVDDALKNVSIYSE